MPSLQIRDLPDDVYEALSYRAEAEGRSLARQAVAELRKLRELESRDRRVEILERIEVRIEEQGLRDLDPAPEEAIRRDRQR